MPIKNVTPPKGAQTRSATKQAEAYKPRFKSDKAQPRSKGGRGNERVTEEDVAPRQGPATHRVNAETAEKRWERVPNAIEFLRRYITAPETEPTDTQTLQVLGLLVECLRAYNERLETLVLNEKKTLTPMSAMRLMDLLYKHHERVGDLVKSPLSKMYDKMRFVVVPEIFIDNDIPSLTLEGIGRCNIMDDISVTMAGDTKDEKDFHKKEFHKWLVANELEDMITQTVNAQTLAAFVRRQLQSQDGLKLPFDHIKYTPVTRAQITRG